MPVALFLLPARSDRLPLGGFRRFPLRLLCLSFRLGLFFSLAFSFASRGFGRFGRG
jgi:hypothetical protein